MTKRKIFQPRQKSSRAIRGKPADNAPMKFHEKIQRHAERLDIKQAEIARRASLLLEKWGKEERVSGSAMNRYWNGRLPMTNEAYAIATVLGVTLDYMLDESRTEPDTGLTHDEEFILKTYRNLREGGIDAVQMVKRMHTDVSGFTQAKGKGTNGERKP